MTRALIPVLLLAVLAPLAPAGQKYDEAKLIAILNSDAPPAQKAIPCKQLAICGTKAAVPALAKLLSSKELASWARIALEAIPDPAADEALRNAVPKLKGRLLVGVINSIGVRKDPKAVDILISKLRDSDQEVAAAAAEALGRIGGEKASAALKGALANTPPKVRSSVAYGCVLCAEKFLAEDKRQEAIALYDAVRKADVPPYRRVEAIRGAIVARGAEGVPLLLEQLRSPEKTFYWAGLRVARELPGAEASKALVAELAKAPPERKPKLLVAIADRGDPASMAAVLEVATSGAKALRIVALEALARVGDASCVPALVAAATSDDQQIATVAKAALARLEGTDVDAEIAARIPKAGGKSRAVLIEMAGRRCIWGALPAVARSIADPDPQVRKAAIAALSGIGTEKQLPDLVAAIQKAKDPTERAAVEKALTAICGRKGAGCVPRVLPLARSQSSALRVAGIHALAVAGGPDALAVIRTATEDKDPAVQDEAIRALANWPSRWPDDTSVLAPLLALAKGGKKPTHRILALRGYLQLLQGTKKLRGEDKLARLDEVLPLVKGVGEKRLVVSVLRTVARPRALELLVNYTAERAVVEEACAAIVEIAPRLGAVPKARRRSALQTVLAKAKSARTKRRAQDLLKRLR